MECIRGLSILVIWTICVALHCWRGVISHNDATGPQCFWLLKLHVQIILKKLRCGYSRKLVFGWHLSMRRPPSTWGRVRACMFHQSQSREHRSMCLSSVALKFCARFFPIPQLWLSRGECHSNIYTPETGSRYICSSGFSLRVLLEVLEMKGKWEGSVLVRPVYFRRPSARGPLCFSVLPQNTWRQVLDSTPPPFQLLTFPQWFSIRPFGEGTKFDSLRIKW